jgi:myeloid leukemia factor 1
MQGERGNKDHLFDPFANFSGFGSQGSLMTPFFGGRDPFDDPFFTRPFGSMFEPNMFGHMENHFAGGPHSMFIQPQFSQARPRQNKGPIIEEINSEDEAHLEAKERIDNSRKHGRSSKEPYVEDPDDESQARKSKQIQYSNEVNIVNGHRRSNPQAHGYSFQSSTITYGGTNGAYYTSSTTRRTGSDGLTVEERKEADSTTGQAFHLLARGIQDKGHAVSRKLKSDGTVETIQALHNLNEDELASFEETWKGGARQNLPGWTDGMIKGRGQPSGQNRGAWALPSTQLPHHSESVKLNDRQKRVGHTTTSRQNSRRIAADNNNNNNDHNMSRKKY